MNATKNKEIIVDYQMLCIVSCTTAEIKLEAIEFFATNGAKAWTFRNETSSNDLATGFNVGIVKNEINRDE